MNFNPWVHFILRFYMTKWQTYRKCLSAYWSTMVFSRKIPCIIASVASWISHFFTQHKFLLGKNHKLCLFRLEYLADNFSKIKNQVRLSLQRKQQLAFAANNKILSFKWKLKLQKTFICHCGLNGFLIIEGFFDGIIGECWY